MEKRQDKFYLYLVWPKYLAQWFAHEMYRLERFQEEVEPPYMYNCNVEVEKLEPVQTRRGSAERNILELFLAKQPDVVPELAPRDATICIEIPSFLNKPAQTYNYLPKKAQTLLEQTVRTHFKVELTKFINKMIFECKVVKQGGNVTNERLIEAFMDLKGIEYNETNIVAIKWIWQELYWREYKRNKKK